MELQLSKQPVTINETVLSTTVEQPIEGDLLLPDYCPDIVRILRSTVEPMITQTSISGDKLLVEGQAMVHIYYRSPNRPLCHTEYTIPFSRTVDLKSTVTNPVISVDAETGYFNCRAVNQRRLDMRGAINLHIHVSDMKEEEIITEAKGMGVQTRPIWVDVSNTATAEDKMFTVREDTQLEMGKPSVISIIRSGATANLLDQKAVGGKLIIKGELAVSVLYLADEQTGAMENTSLTLPISQILDVDDVDDECRCSISLRVGSCDVKPNHDLDGEADSLAVDATLFAKVIACRCDNIPVTVDSYCTKYECQTQQKPVTFSRALEPIAETILVKELLELPAGVEGVADLWVELGETATRFEDGKLQMGGKLMVCMFAPDENGDMEYYDQAVDFGKALALPVECDWLDPRVSYDFTDVTYSLAPGSVEIRCDIAVAGMVFCNQKQNVITDIVVDEEKPLQRDSSSCLTIYFADDGESIWNIAKRFGTAPELILEENELQGDEITNKRMLLIPVL